MGLKVVCIFLLLFVLAAAVDDDDRVVVGSVRREIRSNGKFVCVNLDWWPQSKESPNPTAPFPWANASALTVNFSDPTLLSSLRALSPVHLRVGGSLADMITFVHNDPPAETTGENHCHPPLPAPGTPLGYGPGCISARRYTSLHEMCRATGCKILFGLNGLVGRRPAPNTTALWRGNWDASNARALLAFTKARGLSATLAGVELGNELDGAAGIAARLPPGPYAGNFFQLRRLLEDIFAEDERPLLIGPDSSGFSDSWWYPQFLGNMTARGEMPLDVLTWHLYLLGSGNSSAVPNEILNATYLNTLAGKCSQHHETLITYGTPEVSPGSKTPQFWLGEGGGAYGSGQDGSTNTFLSSFWYADSLGMLAAQGHDAFCRQALVGGNYALLNYVDGGSFSPNPDLYTAILFRHLAGDRVLQAWAKESGSEGSGRMDEEVEGVVEDWKLGGNGTQGNLRSYAFCARRASAATSSPVTFPAPLPPGAVAVLLINLDNNEERTRRVGISVRPGGDLDGQTRAPLSSQDGGFQDKAVRYEYLLTSPDGLSSHRVALNGKLLEANTKTGTLPVLQAISVPASKPVELPPLSLAFVILPDAQVEGCMF